MKPLLAALAVITGLAGCMTQPSLNAGISIGSGGVHVHPSVSARVGAARIAVSP